MGRGWGVVCIHHRSHRKYPIVVSDMRVFLLATFIYHVLSIGSQCVSRVSHVPKIIWYNPTITWLKGVEWTLDCVDRCELTSQSQSMDTADAILYERRTGLERPYRDATNMHQQWIDYNLEATLQIGTPMVADAYDIHMNFSTSADIMATYATPFVDAARVIDPRSKSIVAMASVFISSCALSDSHRHRLAIMRIISNRIPVHSYGKCDRNIFITMVEDTDSFKRADERTRYELLRDEKSNIITRYKFHLAFENTIEPEYVTEKIFDALNAGTVPVYLGTTDVISYVPRGSYIDVQKFPTLSLLVDHLKELDEDDEKYMAYHEWRKHTTDPEWMPSIGMITSRENAFCRLCDIL